MREMSKSVNWISLGPRLGCTCKKRYVGERVSVPFYKKIDI